MFLHYYISIYTVQLKIHINLVAFEMPHLTKIFFKKKKIRKKNEKKKKNRKYIVRLWFD